LVVNGLASPKQINGWITDKQMINRNLLMDLWYPETAIVLAPECFPAYHPLIRYATGHPLTTHPLICDTVRYSEADPLITEGKN
jgi:hypothetical protein